MSIVSVSWGEHLSFGEGDGDSTRPTSCSAGFLCGATSWMPALHRRVLCSRIPGTYSAAPGYRRPSETTAGLEWGDFDVVPAMAREAQRRQGVVSPSYPEARLAFVDRWRRLVEPTWFE